MSEPATPRHARPNEQLDISKIRQLDENDMMDLDLVSETENVESRPESKRSYVEDEQVYDDVDDFRPEININSPFSSGTNMEQLNVSSGSGRPRGRLSLSQQSKFISYCDEQVMNVQRKFVQSRGLNIQNGYSGLSPLLQDLKSVVDFIWYSIDSSTPNTEKLLLQDLSELSRDQFSDSKSTYFGQTAYLIRVADDVMDYTGKFEIAQLDLAEQASVLSKLFKLLFILDHIFARLLDGTIPGKTKMSATDAVRLRAIAERSRTRMPGYLGAQKIHGYHYEVSKIYEESLERCSD
ncbi:ZYBA0S07-05204g1_1 [Zygosaccharomyces bailii CLIB 213]|uniref:ZYBA0S07-05204g1_1 n=1 Tax=Zygosaccharomyces bailii (strain CLIB 213 / ATCC 58445 / CBS 680 / BCRC 21525 / NBRC 1098 / NCYC 1416 / NRRL Y-2227) TaxID=1333698 RepID=A0A8J2T9A2_ZYGB2|nr:ZYBA0S07-05204g1_1 [Zygosaccharomyces bailii CLIB 213]